MSEIHSVTLMTADKSALSGLIYPKEIIQQIIDNQKEFYLGSPTNSNSASTSVDDASHSVSNLRWSEDGQSLIADIKLLNTSNGNAVRDAMNHGKGFFGAKGVGKYDADNVVTEYEFRCVDFVVE